MKKMMDDFLSSRLKDDCCGCGSCALTCPRGCITMRENAEGFLYPELDATACISCGLCERSCPQLGRMEGKNNANDGMEFYAVQINNAGVLKNSASGGVFAELALDVLADGGVVFGSAMVGKTAKHIKVTSINHLADLQGSKYVYSELGNTFVEVKMELELGKRVLFSGVPCQVAALRSFLKKDYDNLVTIDLICHGTPSPKLFNKYMEWLEKKEGAEVNAYRFRDKSKNGWGLCGSYVVRNRKKFIYPEVDPYYASFLRGDTYRKTCYTCLYSNLSRVGDFTLGDFWGVDRRCENIGIAIEDGVSLCILNTPKAKEIFARLKDHLSFYSLDRETACRNNGNLVHSTSPRSIRNEIYEDFGRLDFDALQKRYLHHETIFSYYVKRIRRRLIPKKIRDFLMGLVR